MHSTRTAGVSSIIVVLIGAVAIGAGALMSNSESQLSGDVAMNASSTVGASSSVAISVEEEGVKRTVRSEARVGSQESSGGDSNNAELNSSSTSVITYTEAGFSPQQLTVPVGTTVRFKSSSSTEMWIATKADQTNEVSDDVTLDQECLDRENNDLEQCGVGQEFSFTFQQAGEFNYHNYQNPEHTGTIVVTEE